MAGQHAGCRAPRLKEQDASRQGVQRPEGRPRAFARSGRRFQQKSGAFTQKF